MMYRLVSVGILLLAANTVIADKCDVCPTGTPVPTQGLFAIDIAVANGNHCFAVTNLGSNIISLFSVKNCVPTFIATKNVGAGPNSVSYNRNGKCLVVSSLQQITTFATTKDCDANQVSVLPLQSPINTVYLGATFIGNRDCIAVIGIGTTGFFLQVFMIDPKTCQIITPAIQTLELPAQPGNIAISKQGNCAAITLPSANLIAMYHIDPVTCFFTLSENEPVTLPAFAAFSETGKCLAVASINNLISVFDFSPSTCTLNFNSSFSITGPTRVAYTTGDQCLFVSQVNLGQVTVIPVGKGCTPMVTSATTFPITRPAGFAVLPSHCLLIANASDLGQGFISQFKLNCKP